MARYDKDTFVFSRVPKEARASFLTAARVNMGRSTALFQFMLGATLGNGMTFWQAMFATCLGSLTLEFVSLGLGFMGMKEGLSTSLLARRCDFGRIGICIDWPRYRDKFTWLVRHPKFSQGITSKTMCVGISSIS